MSNGSLHSRWSRSSLHELITTRMDDTHLIVVANREPYMHQLRGGHPEVLRTAGGVTTALDPILRACGGTWVAHGAGNADRRTANAQGRLGVPPEDPKYTLRRVWLTKPEEEGYYHGLSNSGLWPLCHVTFTRPTFHAHQWATYRDVNAKFADAVIEEAGDKPAFIFIQDYHFALLPRMLKERNPNLTVAQFWHIPWPNREIFRTFPWKQELLDGLLGNDLLGFHLRYHCQNFLDTIDRSVEARVDTEHFAIERGGQKTLVRPFPISIDFEENAERAASPEVAASVERWKEELNWRDDRLLGVGVERLDYTKGIPERLIALDRFFELHPEYRERLSFVQIAAPSRWHVKAYQLLDEEVDRLVERINWRWGTDTWAPVIYRKEHFGPTDMIALHQLARFGLVNSLHDGMNLVAKEFVASRTDEDGVLILSQFTGAARELTDALLVNPFAVDEITQAIHTAMVMPAEERRRRMRRLRATVAENNVYRWAGKFLSTLLRVEVPEAI